VLPAPTEGLRPAAVQQPVGGQAIHGNNAMLHTDLVCNPPRVRPSDPDAPKPAGHKAAEASARTLSYSDDVGAVPGASGAPAATAPSQAPGAALNGARFIGAARAAAIVSWAAGVLLVSSLP
jgi:hypothetical protein